MKPDDKLTKKLQTALLAVFVIALSAGTIARMEAKLFPSRVSQEKLINKTSNLIEKSTKALKEIQAKIAKPFEEKFLVKKEAPISASTTNDVQTAALAMTGSIRVEGIVSIANGKLQAIINGSPTQVGDDIYGCKIINIEPKRIQVEANGKTDWVNIFDSYFFQPEASGELILDSIELVDGRARAVFKGRSYRSGDWIDSNTRILAITPTQVLVSRDDEKIMLSPRK